MAIASAAGTIVILAAFVTVSVAITGIGLLVRPAFGFARNGICRRANLLLNLPLIHLYGTIGAASATIAIEGLIAILVFRYGAKEGLWLVPWVRLWRPALATLAMSAVLFVLRGAPIGLQLSLAVATWALALFSLGGLTVRGGPALTV